MAGVWNGSGQQRVDLQGKPLVGARAFFYAADSSDPITTFKDYGLGTEHPNPVVSDARGVFPYVFLDEEDGFFRCRITDKNGVVVGGEDQTVLPIVGPGEGGGGAEVPVDPNSLFQTGDLKIRAGTGAHTGWVRANGRTIGSATSGATERANADTQLLYQFIWSNFIDAICPVTGGRGVSGSADFAANKPIAIPDLRGRVLAGLDDMGNSAAGRLSTNVFSTASQGPTVLGATAGAERHLLTRAQLPAVQPAITVSTDGAHVHDLLTVTQGFSTSHIAGYLPTGATASTSNAANSEAIQSSGDHTHTATIENLGSGEQHNNTQPTFLATIYVRL